MKLVNFAHRLVTEGVDPSWVRYFVAGVKEQALGLGEKESDRFLEYLSAMFLDRRRLLQGGLSNHYKVSYKSHADEVMAIYESGKQVALENFRSKERRGS